MTLELIVSSHPAVLDGFISMFRSEVLEQERELSTGQEKVTSGHNVQKLGMEQAESEKSESQVAQSEPETATEKPGIRGYGRR